MVTALRTILGTAALLAAAGLAAAAPAAGTSGGTKGAAPSPGKPAPAKTAAPALPGELGEMIRVCHVLDDQKETLLEMARQREQILQDWDAANEPKLAAARKSLAEAQAAKDPETAKTARDEIGALEKARADSVLKIDHEMMGVLTTQQRAYWDTYKLYQELTEKFARAGLTDEQLKKVKKIAEDVANLPVPAFADAETVVRVKKEKSDKAYNQVFEKVLTQDQRDTLLGNTPEPKKEEKPAEKPGPKKPAPRKGR